MRGKGSCRGAGMPHSRVAPPASRGTARTCFGKTASWAAVWLCAALFTSCRTPDPADTLDVLAGSELKDLEPLLDRIEKGSGVRLKLRYSGTLDGAERLMAGEAADAAWFSHGKYLSLLQGAGGKIAAQDKIMLSPVLLGLKESKARAWGWTGNRDVTWADVKAKAASGQLRYAMTNPAASNSGFTALVAVATSLSGTGDALREADVDNRGLEGFFKGQALTAGSSGWLADAFVKEQDRLEGIVNYESVLIQLNRGGRLREPLVLIYPKEGVITADYPIMLLNKDKREAYDRLVAYLRDPDFQRRVMESTLRRPVIPQVSPDPVFMQGLVELPFPNTLAVVDRLLYSYLNDQRVPSHAFYVLDVSGSMENDHRLENLKTAMANLSGLDASITGGFARFSRRERVTVLAFNHAVAKVGSFTVADSSQTPATAGNGGLAALRGFVDGLKAEGGTAIFTALSAAYDSAVAANARDSSRYYSMVLMTDGENRDGMTLPDFKARFPSLPPAVQRIKTFTVLFGDASSEDLEEVARVTGGKAFDGRKESLASVFKQIRGYQ